MQLNKKFTRGEMSKSHCIFHLVFGLNFLQNMAQRMGQTSFQHKKKEKVSDVYWRELCYYHWVGKISQDHFIYFPVFRLLHIKWPEFSLLLGNLEIKVKYFLWLQKYLLSFHSFEWMFAHYIVIKTKRERERVSRIFKQKNK